MKKASTYQWKSVVGSFRIGKDNMKDLLYLWFLTLSSQRQARILNELAKKASP
jgi:hypothetical protein